MMETVEVDEPDAALDDGRDVLVGFLKIFFQRSSKQLWLTSVLTRSPPDSPS
jgi:hypothetical protein